MKIPQTLKLLLVIVIACGKSRMALAFHHAVVRDRNRNHPVLCSHHAVGGSSISRSRSIQLFMIGGGGKAWDNQNYLDALGGGGADDDDDSNSSNNSKNEKLQEAAQKYHEFSQSRAAFVQRQQEYAEKLSQTEEGRRHLQQYQRMMDARNMSNDGDDPFGPTDDDDDDDFDIMTSGGGTRMGHMMARAKQQQQLQKRRSSSGGMTASMRQFGFEQKLAPIPLEDEEEDGGTH